MGEKSPKFLKKNEDFIWKKNFYTSDIILIQKVITF